MSKKHSETLQSTNGIILYESQSQIDEQTSFIKSQLIGRVISNKTLEIIKMITYCHPSHGKGHPSPPSGAVSHTRSGGFRVLISLFVCEKYIRVCSVFINSTFYLEGKLLFLSTSTNDPTNYSSCIYPATLRVMREEE